MCKLILLNPQIIRKLIQITYRLNKIKLRHLAKFQINLRNAKKVISR